MDKYKCFADMGKECFALTRKNCEFCNFYKEKEQAIKELKASPFFTEDRKLQAIAKAWEA